MLQLKNNMSIHQRHLQYLALEVFKSLMYLNPEFMWSYFNENPIPYELRKGTKIFLPPAKSFCLGLNSVRLKGSILWNNLPSSIKNSQTINELKTQLKNFKKRKLKKIITVHEVCLVDTFFIFFNFLKF